MALTPKLEIRQSQSLLMTPQLRQAINLLQLSNLELSELLEQEINSNPLLEREDEHNAATPEDPTSSIDQFNQLGQDATLTEAPEPDVDYDNQCDDYGSDRESYEIEDYGATGSTSQSAHGSDDEFDYVEQRLSAQKSLYTIIDEQISLRFTNRRHQFIARLLAERLDAAGYFRGNIEAIASALNTDTQTIEEILHTMQGFEPSGIFATSLAETLTIQLKDINRYDPAMACLLEHLDLVATRNYKELKKLCRVEDEDLAGMLADLKSLNPKPAAAYVEELSVPVIPDVLVSRGKNGSYRIELNQASLPRLLINHAYYSEVLHFSGKNKEARRYLKENLSHASFLIRSLHQRASTILRVSEAIVKHQRDFLEYGIEQLKPMNLRDIAEELELHESTISRVTNRKYMHTPRGTFELKYFFSAAAGTYTGDDSTSTTSIKHQIKQFISEETPGAILSDDKLVELLAAKGIKIARRTVAKYREAMNIATSAERKRLKRSL